MNHMKRSKYKTIIKRTILLSSVFTLALPGVSVAALESGSVSFSSAAPFIFNATVNYDIYAPGDAASPAPSVSDYTYTYSIVNNVITPPAGSYNVPVDRFDLGVGSSASISSASSQGTGIVPTTIDASIPGNVRFLFSAGINPGSSSSQLVVHSPSAPGDANSIVGFSSFLNSQLLRAPFALPVKNFACFDINKIKFSFNKNKIAEDELNIQKGSISYNLAEGFNPAADIVKLSLNNGTYMLSIPAGSFEQKGSKADYKYETGSGVVPRVKFRLNVDKGEWNVSIKDADLSLFANASSVDVMLMLGDTKGQTTIPLTVDKDTASEQKLEYKHGNMFSCPKLRDDDSSIANDDGLGHGHHKRSCLSSFTVTYHSGMADQEVIAKFGGEIGHPETTVAITAGSSATFNTSCGQCLSCGATDISGDFTITELSDATGKLTGVCGMDPSCDITPVQ